MTLAATRGPNGRDAFVFDGHDVPHDSLKLPASHVDHTISSQEHPRVGEGADI